MKKRLTTLFALSMALTVVAGFVPQSVTVASAQNRRIMVEEFTGTWCGWCPRGIVGLMDLDAKYPGQVIGVSIHNQDPMTVNQGPTLEAGVPGLSATAVGGFPNSWVARQAFNQDPGGWTTDANDGTVDQLVNQPADAVVSMSGVSFDLATHMVTATVNVTFKKAMAGDFRFNLYVTQDSMTGPEGSNWDQHNYYYQNPNQPIKIFNDAGTGTPGSGDVAGWPHMHVFRASIPGVWGLKGEIPSTVEVNGTYHHTFSFMLPATVTNPNLTHLIGFVHQYSESSVAKNAILDAEEVKLSAQPVTTYTVDMNVTSVNGQYLTAKAGGDTSTTLTIMNNGSDALTLKLIADETSPLPAGWSIKFTPETVTIPGGGNSDVTATITAPQQSAYTVANFLLIPMKEGAYAAGSSFGLAALSDNTKYAYFYSGQNGLDAAAYVGIPDSMKSHYAVMPIANDVVDNYTSMDWNYEMLVAANPPLLTQDGYYANLAPLLPAINGMLENGKKVFISSTDAMALAFGTNTHAALPEVQSFFNDSLGLTMRGVTSRIANNAYTAFNVKGTTDPIGKGLTLTGNAAGALAGADVTTPFDVAAGRGVTPLFYFDNSAAANAGVKYQSGSGARLVYLAFSLNSLSNQKSADTIFRRSVEWMFSTEGQAGVSEQPVASMSMVAMPNPFKGQTEVRYTATEGEGNVTFAAVNLLGQEIATLPATNTGNGSYVATFDASKLSNGTYVIVARSSKGTQQIRVISEK